MFVRVEILFSSWVWTTSGWWYHLYGNQWLLTSFDPRAVGMLLGGFVSQNSTRRLEFAFDAGYFLNSWYSVARQEMIAKLQTSVGPTSDSRSPDLHKINK